MIGGGINGCVAANYLQRNGFQVIVLDRRNSLGGACSKAKVEIEKRDLEYSSGATVLGMMQDFVFNETGLSEKLAVYAPKHPPVVHFESLKTPALFYDEPRRLALHLEQTWNEKGNVAQFIEDSYRVTNFLVDGYRNAIVPDLKQAREVLGEQPTRHWISGTAKDLLDTYFTSEKTKIFFAIDVNESGPVPLDSPYSAFTIPLMSSGTIFDGNWGYVKNSIAEVTSALTEINDRLGVQVHTGVSVSSILKHGMQVAFQSPTGKYVERADVILFATDPLVAASMLGETELVKKVSSKKMLGTSGKLVMFFRNPVRWKYNSSMPEFDSAFKFIISADTVQEFENRALTVESSQCDFAPGYFEIYCEGAGRRQLGDNPGYDTLAIFFKNLSCNRRGEELTSVRKAIEKLINSYISNKEDLIGSVLITPKDIQQNFFISQGHIDHVEMCQGQTFFDRNYSPSPYQSFYQFGEDPRIFYCGSGAYPTGSVSGTAGYMCAQQVIRNYT